MEQRRPYSCFEIAIYIYVCMYTYVYITHGCTEWKGDPIKGKEKEIEHKIFMQSVEK